MDEILPLLSDPAAWAALATLIAMELVLGIDNLVFISILTNKLPEHQRQSARRVGIGMALVLRLVLLGLVAVIVQMTTPVFELFGHGFSWRDMILIVGGLFLVWKATKEIHHNVDADPGDDMFENKSAAPSFAAIVAQVLLLDLVFSMDSIITAVGMTPHVPIMVVAVVVVVLAMLLAADPLANFIQGNPTIVMLALG
ncbi:MAG: TerC family protein, partial [Geminicoccaceae bacterium]|nr:TerC family protein [Geminicoccaceae bacterium]